MPELTDMITNPRSLRRYYAAMAMQALIASGYHNVASKDAALRIAKLAFVTADAMVETGDATDPPVTVGAI